MKTIILTIVCTLFTFHILFAQQSGISGTITDDNGKPIAFTSVHVKNTTRGTSANSEGKYNLQLAPGQYELLFKAIGYQQESRTVTIKGNEVLNISMKVEIYELKNVTIRANGEDPAYAIIRKAIKKRKVYLNEVDAFSCDVYIKGLQKLKDAPKRFLGKDIDKAARESGLDSNRRGIIYLSESESRYSFRKPDDVHEEMISSKVSGSNKAFSFNRASDMRINFYDNIQNWEGLSNRPFISPIADNALFYYNYKYIGMTVENGETINKIKVIPKRSYDAAFEGYIYIMDDSWRINSVDLYITKRANIFILDTLHVKQQFLPADKDVWMPSSVKFEFNGGLLGFKFDGYFIAIYKNYDLQPSFNKGAFREVMRITREVNKKDSAYWQNSRPIPLTQEEMTDYTRKDALAKKHESKAYLDSVDHANNRVNAGKVLLGSGINIRNRYNKTYYHFNSLAQSVLFNTVEGFVIDYDASYRKQIDSTRNRYFNLAGNVRYGFSNQKLHGSLSGSISDRNLVVGFAAGTGVMDMNNLTPISTKINTLYSLLARRNYEKLYDNQFANIFLSTRLVGSWTATVAAQYSNRKWLPNSTNYSLLKPNRNYTSNNPLVPALDVPLFPENQAFKITLRTSYDFGNKYETYPNGKRYLPSDYPRIDLNFTHGFKNLLGSDVDYSLLAADITKTNINLGILGHSAFFIGTGKFLGNKQLTFIDYKHFSGNQVLFSDAGIDKFLLLDYYTYSTPDKYIEAHIEHNFSGFILNKLPLIRRLKLQEIVDYNFLATPGLHRYSELGVGVQYLTFRAMYAHSYNSGTNQVSEIKLQMGF